jgi:hypothetical protein
VTTTTLKTPEESTAYARSVDEWWPSGMCLNFVWTCLDGVTSAGYPDANAALDDVNVLHEGDRDPPAGVPCYWTGSKHGHVALSLGDGKVRSTDYPGKGDVSTVSIDTLTAAWGRHYEGWAADYNDTPIPGISEEGFLMALTASQQNDLKADTDWTAKRVAGVMPQRYYVMDDDGAARSVASGTPGATPAIVLDTLDGNYIVRKVDSLAAKVDDLAAARSAVNSYGPGILVALAIIAALVVLAVVLQVYPPT